MVNNQWPTNCHECKYAGPADFHPSNFIGSEGLQIKMLNQPSKISKHGQTLASQLETL